MLTTLYVISYNVISLQWRPIEAPIIDRKLYLLVSAPELIFFKSFNLTRNLTKRQGDEEGVNIPFTLCNL